MTRDTPDIVNTYAKKLAEVKLRMAPAIVSRTPIENPARKFRFRRTSSRSGLTSSGVLATEGAKQKRIPAEKRTAMAGIMSPRNVNNSDVAAIEGATTYLASLTVILDVAANSITLIEDALAVYFHPEEEHRLPHSDSDSDRRVYSRKSDQRGPVQRAETSHDPHGGRAGINGSSQMRV